MGGRGLGSRSNRLRPTGGSVCSSALLGSRRQPSLGPFPVTVLLPALLLLLSLGALVLVGLRSRLLALDIHDPRLMDGHQFDRRDPFLDQIVAQDLGLMLLIE